MVSAPWHSNSGVGRRSLQDLVCDLQEETVADAPRGHRFALDFLPPCSPDANRAERLWSEVHAYVTESHRCPQRWYIAPRHLPREMGHWPPLGPTLRKTDYPVQPGPVGHAMEVIRWRGSQ